MLGHVDPHEEKMTNISKNTNSLSQIFINNLTTTIYKVALNIIKQKKTINNLITAVVQGYVPISRMANTKK